ncbi:unnamed protein product, partial [Closterium sp. NIES-65]
GVGLGTSEEGKGASGWQHVGAMYQMGKMHLTGTGVPKNVVMVRWVHKIQERSPWGVMLPMGGHAAPRSHRGGAATQGSGGAGAMGGHAAVAHACFMSSTHGPSLGSLSVPSAVIPVPPFHCRSRLLKAVAERGPWGVMLRWAHACFMSSTQGPSLWSLSRSASSSSLLPLLLLLALLPALPPSLRSSSSSSSPSAWPASCDVGTSLMLYSRAAEFGYEVAQGNAAWLLDKPACIGDVATSWMFYSRAAELGCEVAQGNAAWLLDKIREATDGVASDENNAVGGEGSASVERGQEVQRPVLQRELLQLAEDQGSVQAALLLGDAFFYGRGQPRDLQRAAEAYWRAREKGSAHAMFNLGFMHEHGMGLPRDLHLANDSMTRYVCGWEHGGIGSMVGRIRGSMVGRIRGSAHAVFNLGFMHEHGMDLPRDLHLAKRLYDQVLDAFPRAVVPVRIALFGLWMRMQYGHYPLVSKALDVLPEIGPATAGALKAALRDNTNPYIAPPRLPFPLHPPSSQSKALDVLPEIGPATAGALKAALRDDTNAYIASLLALLLAVLFLRSQRRQQRVVQA